MPPKLNFFQTVYDSSDKNILRSENLRNLAGDEE